MNFLDAVKLHAGDKVMVKHTKEVKIVREIDIHGSDRRPYVNIITTDGMCEGHRYMALLH